MAGALRPVVLLMLFASLLFVLAGVFDGVYPGGSAWLVTNGPDVAALSYVFAIINTVVAALVARGSKRSLVSRVGLAGFFVFERPFSAIVLGPKSTASLVTHLVTAIIELVILLSALRVWQLGNSLQPNEADILFALEGSPPPGAAERRETVQPRLRRLPRRSAWLIGGAALVLAILFIADGAYEGFVPGGREWGTSAGSSGWIVYLFAAVALVVTGRAIQGQRLAMRTLIVLSMIFFIERSFSPFALRQQDPVALALHGIGALASLGLALATAEAIRGAPPGEDSSVTLEAA